MNLRLPVRRLTFALALAAAPPILVAACGPSASVTPVASGSTSIESTSTSSGSTGTTPTTAASAGSSTPPAASDGPYASAIVDTEVVNPAFAGLTRDIRRRVDAAGLPGASLLVLHDGELVEQQAYGYELSTVVPIASASKWLSGAAIMTLVDEGKIELDRPIREYLPGADGRSGAITMRQLLSFTSGLEFDEKIPCYGDPTITLAACNEQILDLPLLGAPGTGYRYTGTHLHVAAGVAEVVTGKTFAEIFAERITGPLGMTSTTIARPLAEGQAPDGHPGPAGTSRSTLGDYGRFLEMLVHDGVAPDGTRILSSAAIDEMGTNQIADAEFVSASGPRKQAETPYGLAHWLDRIDDEGHAVLESSPGKFGFRPWIDHVNDIAGVYLVVDLGSDTDTGESQASGGFVMSGSAEAVGGTLPAR